MAMKNEVNVPLTITIGVISALLLVVAAVAVDGWYKSVEMDVVAQKWDESPNTWLQTLRDEQQANLDAGHKINSRHYRVPVTEAMKIIADHGGNLSD